MKKTILFLSPFDFVEKGIQVIQLTPLHYSRNNWNVEFIVTRDSSAFGSYFYEKPQNPEGITLQRVNMISFDGLLKRTQNKTLRTAVSKIRQYFSIVQLFYFGLKKINSNKDIHLIYGYGPIGTLAAYLLSKVFLFRSLKVVSRFFGISDTDLLISSRKKRILNWEVLLSLSLPVDACIITNDGTEGDKLVTHLFPDRRPRLHFWTNGVAPALPSSPMEISILKNELSLTDELVMMTISRLISWKRIDRSIDAVAELLRINPKQRIKFLIIGGGPDEKALQDKVKALNLEKYIHFTGPLKNTALPAYYHLADLFISTYDLSNVGNPLLEAIRYHKIILTLNNGDTINWIQHKKNGFIFDIDSNLPTQLANAILEIQNNSNLKEKILKSIELTEIQRIQTWEERLNQELHVVNQL